MPIIYRYIYIAFKFLCLIVLLISLNISIKYISLNITKTYIIIFSRPISLLSITHPFLLTLIPTSQSITTLGFTITYHLDYSPHIDNMIRIRRPIGLLSDIFYIILENLVKAYLYHD